MFYIIGKLNDKEYSLMYKKGQLSGDAEPLQKAQEENTKDHGLLGLEPATVSSNYLENEYAAYQLIEKFVFEEITRTKNNWKFNSKVVY